MSPSDPNPVPTLQFCATSKGVGPKWSECVVPTRSRFRITNPIDTFLERHLALRRINGRLGGLEIGDDEEFITRELLLLGFVSATELFFRQLIARTTQSCELIRERAADDVLSYRAVRYYSEDDLEMALTERLSFTEEGMVAKTMRKYWGVETSRYALLHDAAGRFESLCQLRHAVVHSGGMVNSRNSAGLLSSSAPSSVRISQVDLDKAAGVCLDLVRAANSEVGRALLWGWIRNSLVNGDWAADRERYRTLLEVFLSEVEGSMGRSVQARLSIVHSAAKTAAGHGSRRSS